MLTERQIARFWAKVSKKGPDECWEWVGANDGNNGYGKVWVKVFGFNNRRSYGAHRISWIIQNGYVPERVNGIRQVVMHKCDNKKCVNPKHLILATQSENIKDCFSKRRRVNSKTINMIFCKLCPDKPFWIKFR